MSLVSDSVVFVFVCVCVCRNFVKNTSVYWSVGLYLWYKLLLPEILIVMELRSNDTTNYDAQERSRSRRNVKATLSSGSDSGTSVAWNRQSRSARDQSSMSCSNNRHCSENNKTLSQRESAASHDGTNGQLMGDAANGQTANSRQQDLLLYGFFSAIIENDRPY